MDLKSLLKSTIEGKPKQYSENELLQKERDYFIHYMRKLKNQSETEAESEAASYSRIPKFYSKLPKDEETLPLKLREEARGVFLKRRSKLILDNNELKAFWVLLDEQSPSVKGLSTNNISTSDTAKEDQHQHSINYKDFKIVALKAGPKFEKYLNPLTFAKLHDQKTGRVSIMTLFNYVMRKTWLEQTRIGLCLYDAVGLGYLRESDLENYITELIPTLPQLDGMEKSFHSFYVCTAVRKFIFFLDPLRTGRVKIQDILACSFLDDLLELRDEDLPKDLQDANWFSAPSALRVYAHYLNLDKDHNGMLSKEELAGYDKGTLTSVFLDRVFQECLTYESEMDYKTYLDFVLALENRHEPQALQYLFRILDISHAGYLDPFCLNYFFRAIQDQMRKHDQEPVSFEDIKDELFDMIKPADPLKITLQDLIESGQGGTMVSILIDLNGFWVYENREAMAAETSERS